MNKREVVKRAKDITGCKRVYRFDCSIFDGDTFTIYFTEKKVDKEYVEDMYEDAEELKNASVFYRTIEYWADEDDFSEPYWMNCYGDMLEC